MRTDTTETRRSENRDACRDMIRTGSRSFHAASMLLPERVREPAYALYAFCRLSDDAVDDTEPEAQADAVAGLRHRLDLIYAGTPMRSAADEAFADVVADYDMPRELPEALLEGFEWDSASRDYHTLEEVRAYAARVAGSVGAMMTVLMGARDQQVLERACDLGVAMQLTNIARDVGEDARNGRIYLPRDWMCDAGIDPDAWLANPVHDARLAGVVSQLLDHAEMLYARSASGINGLPRDCQPAIHAARIIYRDIGRKIARHKIDCVSQRAVVSTRRKAALLMTAYLRSAMPTAQVDAQALEETAYLVAAAHDPDIQRTARRQLSWWQFNENAVRVVELFEQLERSDRPGYSERTDA